MHRIIEEDVKRIAENIQDVSQKFEGSTVLITGGAGFLGNYFIGVLDYLNKNVLSKPCRIISLDNFITGVKYNVEEGEQFKAIQHNVQEPLDIDEPVDYIIHAAGIASPKFYRKFQLETMDVATQGTRNMLDLAKEKKVKSMAYFSSSEVYGDPDPNKVPTSEDYNGNVSCIGPRANYDESKRVGETYCVVYNQQFGVPVKMIRPFNVYGPGIRMDDHRVIPNFIGLILKKEPITVYGSGNQKRTFCYVSDGITGFLRVLLCDAEGEPFNVGTDGPEVSMNELAQLMRELFGQEVHVEQVEGDLDAYKKSDPQRRCPDLTKVKTLTGYESKVSLKEGISRMMEWAKDTYKIE